MGLFRLYFSFLEEFSLFLQQWSHHVTSIVFAGVVFTGIVAHLLITGHATLGKNGKSKDIACGDKRVWRYIVIFGGPAGMSFGIPYYIVMQILDMSGGFQSYWAGFIYVQFVISILQTLILFGNVIFSERPDETWRFFKSHWKGCGWISALSPMGWWLYLFQQLLPNRLKVWMWGIRDIETTLLFLFNVLASHTIVICLIASGLGQRVIIPIIGPTDQDHKEDEDSSSKDFEWSKKSRYVRD